MATKIIKTWINGSIKEIEVEDIITAQDKASAEDRLVALEYKPVITKGNLVVGNGTRDYKGMTPKEALSHIGGASVVTTTAAEYEDVNNSNTLFMFTDSGIDRSVLQDVFHMRINGSFALQYDLYDNYAVCSGIGNCEDTDIKIGSVVKGFPVTGISENAFADCESLTSIIIPKSITSIGNYAFKNCSNLTKIEYGGTKNAWRSISKGANWDLNADSYFIYCMDGIICKNHVGVINTITPATCTEDGYTTYTCSMCGEVYTADVIPALGHADSEPVIENNIGATCTDSGEYDSVTYCTRCGIETSRRHMYNAALGHASGKPVVENKIDATCIANGKYDSVTYCTRCGVETSRKLTSIPALGHNYTCVHVEPTATIDGYFKYTCSRCDDTYTEFVNYTDFTITKNNRSLIGYTGTETNLDIPLTLQNDGIWYKVTSIDRYAFEDCTSLISITIPHTVTSIGEWAFEDCTSLTSVVIGENVTSIGDNAFEDCSSLTSIAMPDRATSIGNYAFKNCSRLTSVVIGDSVTSIGNYAFEYCSSLTSVVIGNSVTSIGNRAFWYCSSLESVVIGNGVTSIGEYAFDGCSSLTSITIPNSVTSIGKYAFADCTSLTSVVIPDSVTSIGHDAFYGCSSLTSVVIPDSVTSIGNGVFRRCAGLTSIVIPDSVISIGNSAFYGCSRLESVVIGNSVTSIGDYAFEGCSRLTSVVIPDGVTSIGDEVFYGCSNLISVIIPDSVTSIGEYAFKDCTSLTSITMPDSVKQIGYSVLWGCSSLESVTLPFVGTNYTYNGTYSHFGAIFGAKSYTKNAYYVPSTLKSVVITDATSIDNYAFDGCCHLESIVISDGVTRFGFAPFRGCTSLNSLTLPFVGSNKDNMENTFIHLSILFGHEEANIPSSLSQITITNASLIKARTFSNCKNLYNIRIIGNGSTVIGDYALSGCSNLHYITIGNGVTSIGEYAFYGCSSLTSVVIGNSVTSIGEYAFYYCTNLTSVVISNSVTSIGWGAFYGCSNLTDVYYTGTQGQWNGIVIGSDNTSLTNATIHYNYGG